ncbi:permease prefix domain 1-containing protein [Edaphobacter aggregans]|uniref:permease prefix domain 1-containing protein n=1 Tax=Edaphobacter aggregans TaxID=570835 RepID=UPI001FE0BDDF|nr:permease prefix domain 1-containing protein [Edaphobacter aggregans]
MSMFRRKRSAEDFAEEIKAHLELEADDLRHEGLSEDEARRKARCEFGSIRAAQERFYLKSRWVRSGKAPARRSIRLQVAIAESGVHGHGDPDAGARHRRQLGGL